MSAEAASAPSRDWDAATYDRVSDVQFEWALEQLERLPLSGGEVVVDAGCGSGRGTAELVKRVPQGRVYGIDVAPSMVAHARERLGDRATVLRQDLVELDLPEPVDIVFSNATFHWIQDHDTLFAALGLALKPQGRLVAQCGGEGNVASFSRVADSVAMEQQFAPYFEGWRWPGHFASAQDTSARLRHAGFTDVSCWLEPRQVMPPDPVPFVQAVCLVRHLDQLPEQLRPYFRDQVVRRLGSPVVI
ncbi:MAG: class I SAM-dependent methyltransferase, partial [Solirubrobacteraceae bacterium]